MKIKYKFIISLSLILLVFSIVLNIFIRQVLISNMEKTINNSLNGIMNSSRDYIKYRLVISNSQLDETALIEEAPNISNYMDSNYQCDCEIVNMNGKVIQNTNDNRFKTVIKDSTKSALKGKAIINIVYINNSVNGILTYPIYINDKYIGILTVNKNYKEFYQSNKNTVMLITVAEGVVFLGIFLLSFMIVNKITKPVAKLTDAVIKIENGNYDISIDISGKDEISILSREFLNMKDKIRNQINTIELKKDKIEKLEKSRREFFNNVTHELKTPLTAISGYAESLLYGIVDDEEFKKRAIERINSESERLHNLVIDLIDVSKGSSFVEEEKKEIDMYEMLNQICDDMGLKAEKYSLKIIKDISKGNIIGQPNKIRELIINVIDNAIKYSAKSKTITANSYIEEQYYVFETANKSNPIPENIYKNIFNPFVKSDQGISMERSSGLGLYICKNIVREHNGEISLTNGNIITTKIKIPLAVNNLETI